MKKPRVPLFLAAIVGVMIGAQLASATVVDQPCYKYLTNQSAVGECFGGAWLGGCGDCCAHWHFPMNWKQCVSSLDETGKDCGLWTKKWYSYKNGSCDGSDCVYSNPGSDFGLNPTHYERNDVLTSAGCQ